MPLYLYIQSVPGGKVSILGGHSICHSKQNMCPIPKGFRGRAISLCISKIVDKKEVIRTVSSTGIYCSNDKVGKVYSVEYISENSTVIINALCNSCEDM
jgi:hypothetical protein